MNNLYIGLFLSLICLILTYFLFSKLFLLLVFCIILAVLHFKDDFTLFRYVATRVAPFYLWFCEIYYNLQNMYHQSNNSHFPARKCEENNGIVSNKLEKLHRRLKTPVTPNLSSYVLDAQPSSSKSWNSPYNISVTQNSYSNRSPYIQDIEFPNFKTYSNGQREENLHSSSFPTLLPSSRPMPPEAAISNNMRINSSLKSNTTTRNPEELSKSLADQSGVNTRALQPLDAMLYANVNSPGFCSRVAEGLSETLTHQSKYDTVGAFPIVHLKSQSPKVKIKAPVRVRLAPPSNDMLYSCIGASSSRTPVLTADDSMKSVLQVLKEISRKRIHSHMDEDCEESSKRLRINESHYDSNDSGLHTSLLQQTMQGKRAREESSPNEEDVKKRRKPLQNNEISSSLSSSISIKPPHLKTTKRKAQAIDDSLSPTPVLGKLPKVHTEITPPPPPLKNVSTSVSPAVPVSPVTQEVTVKTPMPTAKIYSSSVSPPVDVDPVPVRAEEPVIAASDDKTVSRLLGRLSSETDQTAHREIPEKKNIFVSTNDLSLSPPKENRLVAMIAVLGGPSENLESITSETPLTTQEINIKGKALFTSPATPDTTKQNKKVTFSESLTTTKVFDTEQSDSGDTSVSKTAPVVSHSSPLSTLTFGVSSSPVPSDQKLNFVTPNKNDVKPGSSSFETPLSLKNNESDKKSDGTNMPASTVEYGTSTVSSPSSTLFQMTSSSSTPGAFGTNSPFTVPTTTSSNTSLTSSGLLPSFSFGSDKAVKESKNPNGVAPKPFSFGIETNSSQLSSSNPVFSSILPNTTAVNGISKTPAPSDLVSSAEQNKQSSSLFVNKGSDASPSSKNDNENKKLVNGFASTTNDAASPFAFSVSTTQATQNKPLLPNFAPNTSSTLQTAPIFSFGSPPTATPASTTSQSTIMTSTTLQMVPSTIQSQPASTATQPIQRSGVFTIASNQTKASPFGISNPAPSQNPSFFGNGSSQIGGAFTSATGGPVQAQSQGSTMFGVNTTQTSVLGSSSQTVGDLKTTINTTQSNNLFGNMDSSVPNPAMFGSGGNQQPSQIFGQSSTSALTQSNSIFGIPASNAVSQSKPVFETTSITSQGTTGFGNVSTVTAPPNAVLFSSTSGTAPAGQPTGFSISGGNQISKPLFSSLSNTTPSQSSSLVSSFGNQNNSSAPVFGAQNKTVPSAFGNQNNIMSPAFGGQNNSAPTTFGNQNISASPAFNNSASATFGNPNTAFGNKDTSFGNQTSTTNIGFGTQNSTSASFGTPGAFSLGTNVSSTNEVKAPTINSSPFAFGNTTTSKDPAKPFASAGPFSFGSNTQQLNPSQPSVPTFGSPKPGFGTPTQQQAPTFGSNISQPSSVFAFGQASSAPAPTFQFNAQPTVQGGGMFSIGSGSIAPRSKVGALRRRHKQT